MKVEDIELWRSWMQQVFQPMNVRLEQIMLTNSHLFVGDGVPTLLNDFVAQTETYKVLISRWMTDLEKPDGPGYFDLKNNIAFGATPNNEALTKCIKEQFYDLKRQEGELRNSMLAAFDVVNKPPPSCGPLAPVSPAQTH